MYPSSADVKYPDGMDTPSMELLRRIGGEPDDTHTALEALRNVREWTEDRERYWVLKAREEGLSWHGIATALGRSKQAVWEKYRDPDPRDTING
jgi:hypothetical protein